ncbi:MAG TPA: ABC transporter substrate-binding protein [Candidatus Limnocylindria bacterium]|nr:ABC transporter substrate-binding protein [Candidatus Limnocylindria bacterium]
MKASRPRLRRSTGTLLALVLILSISSVAGAQTQLRLVTWRSEAARVWQDIIADFEGRHPGVKVVLEIGPQSSTEFHALVTQKLRNRDPEMDVFFMDVVWPAEFAAAGWALPLDEFFPAERRQEFIEAPILANSYGGRIYGVPVFVDAGMLYFRKDLLAKHGVAPPRTWPELVRQAKLILAQERDPYLLGYSAQFKQYEGLVCNMMEFIMGNGAAFWDEQNFHSTLQHPAAKEAVRFVRDEIIGAISHRGVLAYQEPESLALFTQGRAIFHRNWPYAWEVANDPKRSKVSGQVGIVPLPAFPGQKSVATLGGWQLGISRFSRNPQLAWQFVEYMTSAETQKRIALGTGRGPALRALYRDGEILQKYPQFESHYETFALAAPRPRTPVYLPLSNIMQRYFSSAVAIRDSNIDRLAQTAARDMDRMLDLLRDRSRP